jgi:hypothetical protein
VVVSSYKKPTDWTKRLTGFDIRCYTKEDPASHYNVDKNMVEVIPIENSNLVPSVVVYNKDKILVGKNAVKHYKI